MSVKNLEIDVFPFFTDKFGLKNIVILILQNSRTSLLEYRKHFGV